MILSAEKITYAYRGSSTRKVLSDFSLVVKPGDFITLLGPNGCGKSTLLKVVAGILNFGEGGQVLSDGKDFLALPPNLRARRVAYVGYDFQVDFPMTAYEAVLLGRTAAGSGFAQHLSMIDREVVESSMKRCLCWDWQNRNVQTLSGGERQLVALARALAQGAKVLFLDESLSQMDLHHQSQIGKMLRELVSREGWAVVLVSHDVNLAVELADKALLMKAGAMVAEGGVETVITEANLKLLYPGAELVVGKNPVTGRPKVFFSSLK